VVEVAGILIACACFALTLALVHLLERI